MDVKINNRNVSEKSLIDRKNEEDNIRRPHKKSGETDNFGKAWGRPVRPCGASPETGS